MGEDLVGLMPFASDEDDITWLSTADRFLNSLPPVKLNNEAALILKAW
jgi:hypothetical protein